jgi:hypothetical protein
MSKRVHVEFDVELANYQGFTKTPPRLLTAYIEDTNCALIVPDSATITNIPDTVEDGIYVGRGGDVYKRENGKWYYFSASNTWSELDMPAINDDYVSKHFTRVGSLL